ncbi:MAG: regulatory protein RecX [Smithella sp.]|nr:regulatory protein RecX [Smithella sp.]
MKKFDLAAAKQKAYRLLSMRPHSEKELAKKLRDKGFPEAVIKEALEKLHDLKYLDDASFAMQQARNLAVNRLWGDRRISDSLREKGIAAGLIAQAIAAARQELPQDEAVTILIRKKTDRTDRKTKQRIFASLMRRGFPTGLILSKLGH